MKIQERKFINKNEIIDNLISMLEQEVESGDYLEVAFGFYYETEHIDVELFDDYFGIDKIIEYIKNKSLDDLVYYYFTSYKRDEFEYIYTRDESLKDLETRKATITVRKKYYFEKFDETDILKKLDPDWYRHYE